MMFKGSCWAFTAAGAIEATTAMTTGQLIDLSPQQLVSCDAKSFGCTGGFIHTAFEYVAQNGGIAPEVVYPYTGTDSACNTALVRALFLVFLRDSFVIFPV